MNTIDMADSGVHWVRRNLDGIKGSMSQSRVETGLNRVRGKGLDAVEFQSRRGDSERTREDVETPNGYGKARELFSGRSAARRLRPDTTVPRIEWERTVVPLPGPPSLPLLVTR